MERLPRGRRYRRICRRIYKEMERNGKKWKEVIVDIKEIIKDLKDRNIKKDSIIEEIFRHGKYYLNIYSDIESCEEVKEEDLEVLADEIIQHFDDAQSQINQ